MNAPVDVLAVLEAVDGILNSPVAVRRAELVRQQAAIREARAAVVELIEAIKPLAAIDLRPDGFDKRDDSQPVYARGDTVITVGDVRRASAAIARAQG